MSKHTPGPWTTKYCKPFEDKGGYQINADGIEQLAYVWNLDYRRTVDDSPGPEFGTTNAEADSRLIAAAPELLEALIRVVAISDRKHDAWDAARVAIAKATGEPT